MTTIHVIVKPNSKKGPCVEDGKNGLIIYVREPAVNGNANTAVTTLLAKHLGVSKSKITIKTGLTSRYKTFTVAI